MPYHYSDKRRANDAHALPDLEVFYATAGELADDEETDEPSLAGWYWWTCMPGYMPEGEPNGPFDTEADALADARDSYDLGDDASDDAQPVARSAFRFFLDHAGYSTPPGKAVCALSLARDERDAQTLGLVFVWEHDDDADLSWLEGKESNGRYMFSKSEREKEHEVLSCRVVLPCAKCARFGEAKAIECNHAETLGSLSGITDADAAYRRVIEAELASDALATLRANPTKL